MLSIGLMIGLGVVGLLVIVGIICAACYVKAPTNVAYVLSGVRKNPLFLIGKGAVKIPVFERKDELYLGQITVDVITDEDVPTKDFIGVRIDAVAKVRVMDTDEGRLLASRNFLNMQPHEIANQLRETLQGNLREIVCTMDLRELSLEKSRFAQAVADTAKDDMQRLGIEILSFNIQTVTDKGGNIENLGVDNTAKIRKDAAINRAMAERDIAIEQARAAKEANDAKVAAELEIAQKQNELAIKQSELKKEADMKRAEADLQYQITQQERQRELNIVSVNAEIAQQERQRELNVAAVNAEIEKTKKNQELTDQMKVVNNNKLEVQIKQAADAEKYKIEQEAKAALEKQKRAAEAARYLAEQDAAAKKAQAEAERYKQEQEALARKAQADAEAYAIETKGKADAEAINAKGIAQAEAIKAQGIAEANALELKAEAYKKNQEATLAEKVIEALPQMAEKVAKPMESIKDVHIYGTNGSNGVNALSANVATGIKQTLDLAKDTIGLDVTGLLSGLGKNTKKEQLND